MILEFKSYHEIKKDKNFKIYFTDVKNKILSIDPFYNLGQIDLLYDTIHWCYLQKYTIDDTINYLYNSALLYKFTTSNGDA